MALVSIWPNDSTEAANRYPSKKKRKNVLLLIRIGCERGSSPPKYLYRPQKRRHKGLQLQLLNRSRSEPSPRKTGRQQSHGDLRLWKSDRYSDICLTMLSPTSWLRRSHDVHPVLQHWIGHLPACDNGILYRLQSNRRKEREMKGRRPRANGR